MNKLYFRRKTCRLCNGHNLEIVLSLVPSPLADAYVPASQLNEVQEKFPLDLFLCKDCGHAQLLDIINPEVLYRNYNYETTSSLGLVEHFKRYADEAVNLLDSPEGSLAVDIGSNTGTLLRFFKDKGMRILGVDPAREIAQKATEEGLPTIPDFFGTSISEKIRSEHGPANIITANNVFAHADNMSEIVKGVNGLLASDGVFMFEASYLVDKIHKKLFDLLYHEHLCYHSIKPLVSFFRQHGLELFDVKRNSSKGGSIRGFVQKIGGPRTISPSINELLTLEANLGIDQPETFKTFSEQIQSLKQQVQNLLKNLKAKGKTIVGYGASATTTTLIYHFGLHEFLTFIVDDYKAKQNLFSPGCHIPILEPRVLYERRPEYVLILAWRYAQPIIKNHMAFINQGGHFIAPLPTVEIV
jgi:hypothetical protein